MRVLTRRQALQLAALGMVLEAGAAARAQGSGTDRSAGGGPDRIIISGASGHLGALTIEALLARGVPARSLILVSRTPAKLAPYARLGAVTRFGDFTQPGSLPAAFAGGTRMLLISIGFSGGPRPAAHGHAIQAAKAAGVKQIAYTSWIGIGHGDRTGIAADHIATEALLRDSGVAWTFLRNSIYMDNLISQAARMLADGRASVPAHENRIGYVTRADCAASAAAALSPGHDDRVYDITGPALLGVREVAAAATAATGRAIRLVAADPNAAPPRGIGGPAAAVVSNAVEQLTGHPATPVAVFFAANRARLLG